MKRYFFFVLTVILYSSCACQYYPSTEQHYHKIKGKHVSVHYEPMPENVKPIGTVICHANEHRAYKKARKLSGKHGANGLYVISGKDISVGQEISNALLGTGFTGRYKFAAVRN